VLRKKYTIQYEYPTADAASCVIILNYQITTVDMSVLRFVKSFPSSTLSTLLEVTVFSSLKS